MWIEGADLDALASAFQLDLAARNPCYLSEILDHESTWVAEVNGWFAIVPARDDDAFLRSVTEGGRRPLSLSMNMYARDGRMLVAFAPTRPEDRYGEGPEALDHLTDGAALPDQ
ncbi:hypothetical protein [Nonomuraea endophytica]|uniref:hypothetical protein n=1 Tax=Nonomuraea endophytica TaxID=714136 RepID=UPI0037C74B0E